MPTPDAPLDASEIDSGWDDLESSDEDETTTSDAPPSFAPSQRSPTPSELPAALARAQPKRPAKSKDARDAKADRKAAKQAARRAERRAASALNQKRPTARPAAVGLAPSQTAPKKSDIQRAPRVDTAKPAKLARTRAVFTPRRTLIAAAVVACLLLVGALAWFLGWRNGGTMSLQ
jgi:hypothetical protein